MLQLLCGRFLISSNYLTRDSRLNIYFPVSYNIKYMLSPIKIRFNARITAFLSAQKTTIHVKKCPVSLSLLVSHLLFFSKKDCNDKKSTDLYVKTLLDVEQLLCTSALNCRDVYSLRRLIQRSFEHFVDYTIHTEPN